MSEPVCGILSGVELEDVGVPDELLSGVLTLLSGVLTLLSGVLTLLSGVLDSSGLYVFRSEERR